MISDRDGVALVDACLDDGMRFCDIVKQVRQAEWAGLVMTVNTTLYWLGQSNHIRAPEVAASWVDRNKEA